MSEISSLQKVSFVDVDSSALAALCLCGGRDW